jgi:hypothetical protein
MEKARATRLQVLTALTAGLRSIRRSGQSVRPQDKITHRRENNPFKKVTHATGPQRNKHPDESKVKRRRKLKEHPAHQGLYRVQETHLHHH